MRLLSPILTALLVLAAFPAATSASQGSGSTAALVRPAPKFAWTPDKKNPYSRLFVGARQLSTPAAPAPPAAGKPEIKCGMTVIPADPGIDPRIAIAPRPPDGTRFTIRAIDPPICR